MTTTIQYSLAQQWVDLLIPLAKAEPGKLFVISKELLLFAVNNSLNADEELDWWRNGPNYCEYCSELFGSYQEWLESVTYLLNPDAEYPWPAKIHSDCQEELLNIHPTAILVE